MEENNQLLPQPKWFHNLRKQGKKMEDKYAEQLKHDRRVWSVTETAPQMKWVAHQRINQSMSHKFVTKLF